MGDQYVEDLDPVILLSCLFPGNSLVENISLNMNNILTLFNETHVSEKYVSDMNSVGSSQHIALITATYVFILVLAAP